MAKSLDVYQWQRLVPIRFTRAAGGRPRRRSPDIDDRGYVKEQDGRTVRDSPAFGPVVGIMQGDTIRVKIVREWIELAANLYANSSDDSVVHMTSPGPEETIDSSDDVMELEGMDGSTYGNSAKIFVRYDTGSFRRIIAELGIRVYTPRWINLRVHRASIGGTRSGWSDADVRARIRGVNRIWRPAGIQFRAREIQNDADLTFATAGQVSSDAELNQVMGQGRGAPARRIHLYLVPQLADGGSQYYGIGLSSDYVAANPGSHTGVCLATDRPAGSGTDQIFENDIAHELGHYMGLWHPERREGNNSKQDIWSRRQLMHNWNPDSSSPNFRRKVGYGRDQRGAMIPIKDLINVDLDNNVRTCRRAIAGGIY